MPLFGKDKKSDDSKREDNDQRIQDFINRFHQKSRDLDTSDLKKETDQSDPTWQGYNWIGQQVSTSDDRAIRNKEYREMCKVPELNLGVSIYADNSTQSNIANNVLEIQSENNKITEILETLFYDTLDINANLWAITRNMCKLGDEFMEVIVDNDKSPKHIISIDRIKKPERMNRVEKKGILEKFAYVTEDRDKGEKTEQNFAPWRIVHFRIEEEDFAPYGKSILEPGRKTWKKLALMEDAMLVYRVSRAPERRVFYIDVGTLSTKDSNLFIEQVKRKFKKKSFINPSTGEIDEKADVMGVTEDFYIPVRANSQGTRIETLPPGQNLGEIDDVKYFKDIILKTMGIPPGYMGGGVEGGSYDPKSYLSNQEIQFSRTIERIQKFLIKGLEKVAIMELAFNKVDIKEINNFKIVLTPPSNVDQLMEIEIRNQQFALVQTIKALNAEGTPFLADNWIYKNILGMSEREINKVNLQSQMQMQMQQQIAASLGGEAGAGAAGMSPISGMGGNIAPGEAGGISPGEAGGPAPMETDAGGGEAGEAGLEIASNRFVEFDGGNWLMENISDVQKLLKYLKLYEKDKKDIREVKIRNSARRMTIKGELKGIVKVSRQLNELKYSSKSEYTKLLNEEKITA